MPYQEFEPERVRHLELVQAIVGRLGTDSFLLKGWAVTLNTALFGFAISGKDWRLAALAVGPSVALWALDAYFLRAERLFRELYEAIRTGTPLVEPFYLSATSKSFVRETRAHRPEAPIRFAEIAWSQTLRTFYLVLVLLAAALAIVLRST